MKLVSYAATGGTRLGAVEGDLVYDLNRANAAVPADILGFLEGGAEKLAEARDALDGARTNGAATPLADVKLLPPVPRPPKIVCLARNYAEHAKEAGFEMSQIPIMFARFAATLVADGDPVIRPTVSHELDWEGELAVIIGTGGRHISRESALDHVAGYSIFNDVTVRDYQFRVTQYTAGKNFSGTGPFGPYLVTKDEVPDPHALDIRLEVNGVVKQQANTGEMFFDVPTIIEHVSEWIALEPGDVIAMGTPAGVGFKRTPPEFLLPGDVVSVTVEQLGTLTNPVIDEESTNE